MPQRTRILAAAFTALATYGPAASAAHDQVLAQGRNVRGTCVFDRGVVPPRGTTVRADASCRLLASPTARSTPLDTWGPAAIVLPKASDSTTDASWPSVPTVQADNIAGEAAGLTTTALDATQDAAAGFMVFRAWARQDVYNELAEVVYHDEIDFTYRQSRRTGAISAVTVAQAYCATSVVAFPHRPGISRCWWRPGMLSATEFSFTSGGTYYDRLLLAGYDQRNIDMGLLVRNDLTYIKNGCSVMALPPGWSQPPCDMGREYVSG